MLKLTGGTAFSAGPIAFKPAVLHADSMTNTNSANAPADFSATDANGERIDLRDLSNGELEAYRAAADEAGDLECVRTIDFILGR